MSELERRVTTEGRIDVLVAPGVWIETVTSLRYQPLLPSGSRRDRGDDGDRSGRWGHGFRGGEADEQRGYAEWLCSRHPRRPAPSGSLDEEEEAGAPGDEQQQHERRRDDQPVAGLGDRCHGGRRAPDVGRGEARSIRDVDGDDKAAVEPRHREPSRSDRAPDRAGLHDNTNRGGGCCRRSDDAQVCRPRRGSGRDARPRGGARCLAARPPAEARGSRCRVLLSSLSLSPSPSLPAPLPPAPDGRQRLMLRTSRAEGRSSRLAGCSGRRRTTGSDQATGRQQPPDRSGMRAPRRLKARMRLPGSRSRRSLLANPTTAATFAGECSPPVSPGKG